MGVVPVLIQIDLCSFSGYRSDRKKADFAMEKIVVVNDSATFKAEIDKARLTVVHFWASWAAQCQPMEVAMGVLAEELPEVGFVKVPAEGRADVSMEYNVAAVPTFIFFRQGKVLDTIEGANAAETSKRVRELAKSGAPKATPTIEQAAEKPKEPLDVRLKKLINSSKCVLFMKGDRDVPKCGFSRQTIELLNSLDAEYATFDIFSDEEVRQGLKTYSKDRVAQLLGRRIRNIRHLQRRGGQTGAKNLLK